MSQYLVNVNHYSIKRQFRADFGYSVHKLYLHIHSSPLAVAIHLPSGCAIQWLWIRKPFQISTSCLSPWNRSTISDSVIPSCMHLSTKMACFKPVSCNGFTLSPWGGDVGNHLITILMIYNPFKPHLIVCDYYYIRLGSKQPN